MRSYFARSMPQRAVDKAAAIAPRSNWRKFFSSEQHLRGPGENGLPISNRYRLNLEHTARNAGLNEEWSETNRLSG